MTEPMYTNIT